jgi:hypothetical protein
MTNLQELKNRIYEICPELKELKMGCKVSWTYEHSLNSASKVLRTKKGIIVGGYGSTNLIRVIFEGNKNATDINLNKLEIIGHPITLEAVLKAINKNNTGICINADGTFCQMTEGDMGYQWKLGEPLEKQSEECVNFLHNLICK